MPLNFSLDGRFTDDEQAVITRLMAASRDGRGSAHNRSTSQSLKPISSRLPPTARVLARRVRRTAARWRSPALSVPEFCDLATELVGEKMTLDRRADCVRWTVGDQTWTYPASTEKLLFFGFLTAVGPARWLGAKYTLPDFLDIEPHDVVIDCGAFVGGFTRAALGKGAAVVSIEPSRTNRACLNANLAGQQSDVRAVGLGPINNTATFREASTGVDSSFIALDEGSPTATYDVDVLTIETLCESLSDLPTFLKIEAEGMESAILGGMGDIRPAKIAVDASPEGGSNDHAEIVRRLEDLGYTVRSDLNMVYARL